MFDIYQTLEILNTYSSMGAVLSVMTPFVLLLEMPLQFMVIIGMFIYSKQVQKQSKYPKNMPKLTCVLICYAEGEDIILPIKSLAHQLYPGEIEILIVVDGAIQNKHTYSIALSMKKYVNDLENREIKIIPKWQRGGRVSSTNAAIKIATGKIFMALDGDTTFDNDMAIKTVANFDDPNIVALTGNLRVKNSDESLVTKLQTIEYMLSIGAGKSGLSSFNMINTISGAFSVFRIEILELLKGWDNGAAEDLDITMRLKEHFGRNPNWRIAFDPHVIGHTQVPTTLRNFFIQRMRWEGDLFYIIMRKYINNIRPSILGGLNYIFSLIGIYFFQIIMPFVITIYSIMTVIFLPMEYIVALSILVYSLYFIMLLFLFISYILLISDRVKEDIQYIVYLPIYIIFIYIARINAAVALLQSIINKSHLDSNMAPWWVLKKGNL